MTRGRVLRAAVFLILAAAGLLWMNSFAPLQWPSVLVYSGIVIAVGGVVSTVVPPSWSGFPKRIYGLFVGFLAGALLFAAGSFWPARTMTSRTLTSRIDAFMPTYDFHERHEITIHAPADRVREALNHMSFADIGVMQTLGKIRAIAMRRTTAPAAKGASPSLPIVEMIRNPRSGFFPLDDNPHEFVFGLAGQPWNNAGVRLSPAEFRDWSAPASVKIAANFLIEDAGAGNWRVITETRVAANDTAARRKMAKYWALIYPGSGMIRVSLLNTIRDRAEHR